MAIAFDAVSFGAVEFGNSFTFSHTCTGSNRILHVFVTGEDVVIDSVTYNSVALTKIKEVILASASRSSIWELVNPASGANTVAVNFTPTDKYIRAQSISHTGASQSAQPDATASIGSGASPLSSTITTIADNCWSVVGITNYGGLQLTASTNVTARETSRIYLMLGDNNADITPAGNLTQTVTYASGTDCRILQASIAPVAVPGVGDIFPIMTGRQFWGGR